MKKLITTITLIFYIAFFMVLVPIQTYAVLPAVALSVAEAGALETVATALVATGLTFAVKEAAQNAAEWVWNKISPTTKENIAHSIDNAVDEIVTLPDTVWTEVKELVQSECVPGESTYIAEPIWGDGVEDGIYIKDAEAMKGISYLVEGNLDQVFAEPVDIYSTWISWTFTNGTCFEYRWEREGDKLKVYERKLNAKSGFVYRDWSVRERYYVTGDVHFSIHCVPDVEYCFVDAVFPDGDTWNNDYSQMRFDKTVNIQHGEVFSYAGADVLSNPTWDFDKEGKRMVTIPPVIDDIIGKTYTDVIAEGSTCDDGTVIGDTPGDIPSTGDLDEIIDINTELDFSPLQIAGEEFTNKFPFSLPWDLKRSIESLSTKNNFNPIFDIAFTAPLIGDVSFSIDLSTFNDLVEKIRVFELITFDIALIFATRKLLGGAT